MFPVENYRDGELLKIMERALEEHGLRRVLLHLAGACYRKLDKLRESGYIEGPLVEKWEADCDRVGEAAILTKP